MVRRGYLVNVESFFTNPLISHPLSAALYDIHNPPNPTEADSMEPSRQGQRSLKLPVPWHKNEYYTSYPRYLSQVQRPVSPVFTRKPA
jgi:hypothetical protein